MDATMPTRAEIIEIGEGFLDTTYPGTSFNHREHLIMATYLRCTYPDWLLADQLPGLIRRYNVAQGGVNDADNGYHHTITLAYLELIDDVLAQHDGDDVEGACAAVLQSPIAAPNALLTFWNRSTLFSRKARAEWVEPDVQPLSLPKD